jgi:hypothetical protein
MKNYMFFLISVFLCFKEQRNHCSQWSLYKERGVERLLMPCRFSFSKMFSSSLLLSFLNACGWLALFWLVVKGSRGGSKFVFSSISLVVCFVSVEVG